MQVNRKNFNFRSQCCVSSTLDLIGDKWTLLIIRDALIYGFTTFGEFSKSPEKIATNILTNRLEKLVNYGIFEKFPNTTNKLKIDYKITQRGQDLAPILMAIGKWGYENIEGVNNPSELVKQYQEQKHKHNNVYKT